MSKSIVLSVKGTVRLTKHKRGTELINVEKICKTGAHLFGTGRSLHLAEYMRRTSECSRARELKRGRKSRKSALACPGSVGITQEVFGRFFWLFRCAWAFSCVLRLSGPVKSTPFYDYLEHPKALSPARSTNFTFWQFSVRLSCFSNVHRTLPFIDRFECLRLETPHFLLFVPHVWVNLVVNSNTESSDPRCQTTVTNGL